MNYDEYIEYINHLFLQRLVDFEYHERADALTILGDDDA